MSYINDLVRLDACSDAVAWCRGYATLQEAWDACERSDWMWWLICKAWRMDPPCDDCHKHAVLCACDIAESVKHLWTDKTRKACANAIETARKWTRGEATQEECMKAAAAAAAAATAAAADAAHAAYAAARRKQMRVNCNIIRHYFPAAPEVTALGLEARL